MKLFVNRQACCSQDDQIGPLQKTFELEQTSDLEHFITEVIDSGFLQFSSSHTEMVCRIGRSEVARVYAPSLLRRTSTVFLIPPATEIWTFSEAPQVEFVFDKV